MATKPTTQKMKLRNLSLSLVAAFSVLTTSNLAALGLGALEVKSNLDQPLDGTIELRVAPGDDLGSVTATIANQEDFEKLGIDYPAYLSDMSLSVESMGGDSYVLRVVSGDVIIKEPFIHFLVRVDWSGGSFLREYTALIDPPVYAAEAPQSIAEPRVVGTDESFQTAPEPEIVAETLDQEESIEVQENVEEVFTETTPDPENQEYLEPDTEQVAQSDFEPDTSSFPTDAQYGPVASGESLSVIAQELQRQFPDLSIYQIMQVLFEENRDSFINENINGLMQGAVLNIGDLNAIRQVDIAQARRFFYDQLSDWDPSVLANDSFESDFDGIRVGQDEYSFDDSIAANDSADFGSDTGGSEVDVFQVGASTETDALVSSGNADARAAEVLAMQQQISELETSLASSNLENQELTERISLLEGQLADMNRLLSMDVEDAEMAAVESTLAEQNAAQDDFTAADPLADSFDDSLDSSDGFADPDALVADDSGFIDPLANLDDTAALDGTTTEEGVTDGVEQIDTEAESLDDVADNTEVTETEVASSTPAPAPAKQTSFLSDLQSSVVDSGLWKILAGAGALVLGGLGLWFARRRRADEEFEISMMSIESQSYSAASEKAVTVPEEEKSKNPDRETSFLTVYSDSDAVVQADEVDPVAEADVYIAYGRDEQAEEVLLDGIAGQPSRVDIKQKLLTLYHKNNNVEGFERIAEELYSQKNFLTKNVWQEVSLMGKDLAPENPLFDVSSSDLLEEGAPEDRMITSGDAVESDTTIEAETMITEASEEGDGTGIEFAEEDPSINLINFDEGHSELSELDQVDLDELNLDDDQPSEAAQSSDESTEIAASEESTGTEADENEEDSVFEIDISEEVEGGLGADESSVVEITEEDTGSTEDEPVAEQVSTDDGSDEGDVEADVSDLEIGDDYDEARTQYELAKVFVDLGDEDGARKILGDIVANADNSEDVLEDASKLLESIDS